MLTGKSWRLLGPNAEGVVLWLGEHSRRLIDVFAERLVRRGDVERACRAAHHRPDPPESARRRVSDRARWRCGATRRMHSSASATFAGPSHRRNDSMRLSWRAV